MLIQNSGCLVTKDKFLKEVWPDTFVEEANLSVNIASLRKVLDEGGAERQYIQTVTKELSLMWHLWQSLVTKALEQLTHAYQKNRS